MSSYMCWYYNFHVTDNKTHEVASTPHDFFFPFSFATVSELLVHMLNTYAKSIQLISFIAYLSSANKNWFPLKLIVVDSESEL